MDTKLTIWELILFILWGLTVCDKVIINLLIKIGILRTSYKNELRRNNTFEDYQNSLVIIKDLWRNFHSFNQNINDCFFLPKDRTDELLLCKKEMETNFNEIKELLYTNEPFIPKPIYKVLNPYLRAFDISKETYNIDELKNVKEKLIKQIRIYIDTNLL